MLPDPILECLVYDRDEAHFKLFSAKGAAKAFLQHLFFTLKTEEMITRSEHWLHAQFKADRAIILIVPAFFSNLLPFA